MKGNPGRGLLGCNPLPWQLLFGFCAQFDWAQSLLTAMLPAGSAGEKTAVPLSNGDPLVAALPLKKNWPLMADVLRNSASAAGSNRS